jgi:hypothetical protein
MYAVSNVTSSAAFIEDEMEEIPTFFNEEEISQRFAAIPSDIILQLDATTIAASNDGKPISAWANSASSGAHSASQPNAASQPTYHANNWPGGKPSVHFSGTQFLSEANLNFPSDTTLFAAVRDTGTTTSYCSGVLFINGAEKSICTKQAVAEGKYNDDDPSPVGTDIIATVCFCN